VVPARRNRLEATNIDPVMAVSTMGTEATAPAAA
jgi:hypothetical protein